MKFHNPIFFFIEYNELSLCISTVIDFYNLPLIKELNSFHWKMNYEIDLLHEISRDVEPHNLKITYKIEVLESHRLFVSVCIWPLWNTVLKSLMFQLLKPGLVNKFCDVYFILIYLFCHLNPLKQWIIMMDACLCKKWKISLWHLWGDNSLLTRDQNQ